MGTCNIPVSILSGWRLFPPSLSFYESRCVFTCTKLANHYAHPQQKRRPIVRSCNIHLLFFDAHRGPVSTIRQILLESDRCYFIYVISPNSIFLSPFPSSSAAISCRQAHNDLTLFVGCLYQILMFRNAF